MPAIEYPAVVPYLTASPAGDYIDFLKRAFGFAEHYRMVAPDGKTVAHAELLFRDTPIMLADEFKMPHATLSPKALGGTTGGLHLRVPDVDAAFAQAVAAGATVAMPPTDMFWGDRYCKVVDPFGHHWSLATQKEQLSPEEVQRRGAEAFKSWGSGSDCA